MTELAIFLEGQNGLNWPRWQRLAAAAEDLGYAGLYRSDHFTNPNPPDKDALELWISLAWLASHTRRIEFGPLVSPVSFRHPANTARMAAAVDDLSGGRLVLGLGAGWQEREHTKFGFDLLDLPDRFDRFEEGLEVISHLLKQDKPADYSGKYYQLREATLLPRPDRPGGPPILIGARGPLRSMPLVARFADEWNAFQIPPERFVQLNQLLDKLLAEHGRRPEEVRRSIMVTCIFGRDESQVQRRVAERTSGQRTAEELRRGGALVGTPGEMIEQIHQLAEAGVQRIMLQWIDLDDLQGLEIIANQVAPQVT